MLKSIVREGLCKTRRGEKIKMCQEFSWPVKNPENLDKMRKCRKWNIYYHTQLNPRNNPFHKILSPPLFLSLYLTLSLTHKHTQANACRHTHTHTHKHTHTHTHTLIILLAILTQSVRRSSSSIHSTGSILYIYK